MSRRNGIDALAVTLLGISLLLQWLGTFLRSQAVMGISLVLYAGTLQRIFSKRDPRRQKENARFLAAFSHGRLKRKQFFLRLRLRRQYRYFRCPQCKTLLRIPRGQGEKNVSCPRCGRTCRKKS